MRPVISSLLIIVLCLVSGCASISAQHQRRLPPISSKPLGIKARVVIDPGHGGEDSGAIGRRGLMEKDITLDIAKRIVHLFKTYEPGVEVILTRTADRYVALEERVKIANTKKAHAFISLHVNSSESKEANGFEIFSLDVASDRHAERLAARENKVFKQKNNGADLILADLRAFSHRKDSDRLASYLAQGLTSQLKKQISKGGIHDRGYNQAIFHVLFVKMPAVLTELFFVSNPQEEKMLSTKEMREQLARGVFLGVRKFVSRSLHASR